MSELIYLSIGLYCVFVIGFLIGIKVGRHEVENENAEEVKKFLEALDKRLNEDNPPTT